MLKISLNDSDIILVALLWFFIATAIIVFAAYNLSEERLKLKESCLSKGHIILDNQVFTCTPATITPTKVLT